MAFLSLLQYLFDSWLPGLGQISTSCGTGRLPQQAMAAATSRHVITFLSRRRGTPSSPCMTANSHFAHFSCNTWALFTKTIYIFCLRLWPLHIKSFILRSRPMHLYEYESLSINITKSQKIVTVGLGVIRNTEKVNQSTRNLLNSIFCLLLLL